jgi:copper chaperone CopZ
MTHLKLIPARIGCPSLPGTMKGIVTSLEGVDEVAVHYEERSLDITYNAEKILPAVIIEKIGSETGISMVEESAAQ